MFNEIKNARLCNSTDPRDMVYGFISFDGDQSSPVSLSPDYTISVKDLYRNVSKAWLQQDNRWSLEIAGRQWQRLQGLPSWTTD